jgi:hypothetical protein
MTKIMNKTRGKILRKTIQKIVDKNHEITMGPK